MEMKKMRKFLLKNAWFKIDLIVWKSTNMEQIKKMISNEFKIDLIVWKLVQYDWV